MCGYYEYENRYGQFNFFHFKCTYTLSRYGRVVIWKLSMDMVGDSTVINSV